MAQLVFNGIERGSIAWQINMSNHFCANNNSKVPKLPIHLCRSYQLEDGSVLHSTPEKNHNMLIHEITIRQSRYTDLK